MSLPHDAFAAVLLARRIITPEQLIEAWQAAAQTGASLEAVLQRLGHATVAQLAAARAAWLGVPCLDRIEDIPLSIVELMPESVARENLVLPLAREGRTLTVVMADISLDVLQKLEFILNVEIRPSLAPREMILEAINRHYGQCETESVDSCLMEFTDTAIDFTETADDDSEMTLDDTPSGISLESCEETLIRPSSAARMTSRRATVRYYSRMNPQRLVPLLVILSRDQVAEVSKTDVRQACSQAFQVAEGSVVEIEPVLPGCACYPPREQVRISAGEASVTFWVAPQVLGRVMDARIIVRQQGATLTEVPLEMRVVRQSLTQLMGALSLVLPFGLLLLKHFELDFESQLKGGFGLYAWLAGWLVQHLTPEVLTGLLLAVTVCLYFWLRPRQREVFWDIHTQPEEPAPETIAEMAPLPELTSAIDYFRAALAAGDAGDNRQALGILLQAEAQLPAKEMTGPMWYNLGCYATRLGRFADALRYLNRAIDRGFVDLEKYRNDPDLEPLRWNAGFRGLLAELGQ